MGPARADAGFKRHPEEFPVPDPKDASTPDAWVKRNPALVRLTGRHPFNVEPPLPLLEAHGHSTPASLHYAKSLSMADLEKFPKVVVPSLLVCAGNRRKEQNMIKRTIGFNWGAAGLGMSEWGGCHLADVLASLGAPTDPAAWDGGGHVCFRGPDKELPGGADGSYGTSLTLRYVMDKSNDVILAWDSHWLICTQAWEQNGERLQADHGFPLRILIPGFIGGRMVKWLKEIKISPEQSDNHYHFKDNRVLPVNVTPEQAEAEGWWFKPDYIINELNINSAMFHPGHGEVLDLATAGPTYDVEGYAYGGAGRKIIRVEVTLDGGASWFLVKDGDVTHPPNTPNKAGKYWGWCFWKITVPTADLLKAPDVACRAWDAAMNTQPSNLTWNVMGMLNNPWFTVVKHFDAGPAARRSSPRARRPCATCTRRRRRRRGGGVAAAPRPRKATGAPLGNTYTLADVAKHDTPQDCWIAVNGVVYDTNPYLAEHPGGASSITMNAGTDATDEFTAIHSRKAWTLLDNDDHVLGLPTGQHVLVYGQDAAGKSVARAYTPATADEVTGRVDFVIKAYRPLPPRFPDGGALSQHLCDRIAVGSEVEFRGPMGEIEYLGGGAFEVHDDKGVKKRIAVAADAARAPALSFLLGNRTEADILCRDEIEAAQKAGAVDLHYTLDKPPPGWPHHTGFIDDAMLAATMPKPAKDTYFFCCGPPPMIKSALAKLEAAGHSKANMLCFGAERR
ncbi:hypothetical protein JL721_12837 [Aureococcus anophagefferens]|nr:hypothetical protein JL721_12837 [Aureococcus anophagefferens]